MQLLEHFKDLTLHPKNAEELEGLILQLAIQGKLTAQWRKDNPHVSVAADLLGRIKEYNHQQLKLNKRRVNVPKGGEEAVLDIPESWVQVKNHDLFNLQKGKNPKDLSETKKTYVYQDIAALDRGNIRRYSDDEKATKCKDSDILVVCDGSRSGLVLDGKYGIVGSTLAIIHTPPFIKEYIKVIFLEDFQRANANMIGAAIPHLDTKGLLLTSVGLPPLEEQKAIVAVVKQLFAEVEQLEQLTKKRIQLKEDFVTSALRQLSTEDSTSAWAFLQPHFKSFFTDKGSVKKLQESILQLAVQGKLTHHWRTSRKLSGQNTEDASVLLEQIQAEKGLLIKAKTIKKEKPLPTITEKEIPYSLPEGWEWCRLEDLTSITGGVTKGKKNQTDLVNIPYLRVANVQRGYLNLDVMKEILVSKIDYKKYQLLENDLLMIEGGDPDKVGRCAIWSSEISGCIYQNHVFRVRPFLDSTMDNHFFMQFINSRVTRDYYESCAKRTTNLASINKTQMRSTPIAFPPLEEQKAIVQKVNALMALCDTLEKEIETHQTSQEHWMQSCLKEVFEYDQTELVA